jgi:hypothetical protein
MPTFDTNSPLAADELVTPNGVRDRVEGFLKAAYEGRLAAGARLEVAVRDPDQRAIQVNETDTVLIGDYADPRDVLAARLGAVFRNWLGRCRDRGAAARGFTNRVGDQRLLRTKGVVGGYECVTAVPSFRRNTPVAWRIKVRQLLVVGPDSVDLPDDPALAAGVFLAESSRTARTAPTRQAAAEAFAWVSSYPAHVVRGPLETALEYLGARQGQRLTTRFGTLSGPGHA